MRHASVLAATARPNANYAANLHTLAMQLLQARDGDTAQQLFSLAFANMLPVHLPESLAGRASARNDVAEANVWQQPPTASLRLRPVSRSYRGEHSLEDPVIVHNVGARELIKQYEERLQQETLRFSSLFAAALLDLATLKHITADERAILLTVIDGCLGDTRHQYRAPDGSTITLLNYDEQSYAILRAPDGMLLLPRYRLQRDSGQEGRA